MTLPPTLAVGSGPDGLAFDAGTHTLYTVNQNSNTLSVLDTEGCDAGVTAHCEKYESTVPLGTNARPEGVAIDYATDTIYVADNGNGIAVIRGATCDALNHSGCEAPLALVGDASGPLALAVNQSTNTVYVANFGTNLIGAGTTVSVLDGAACNSRQIGGCSQVLATVPVGQAPDGVAVDPRTDTVYVVNGGLTGNGDTVSVIDGSTCDSQQTSGCDGHPATIAVGHGPNWIALDLQTHTAYTANQTDADVSVINIATCNATESSGCAQRAAEVPVGSYPWALTIDSAVHTVYVANNKDQTLSVINSATCNATVRSSCSVRPPTAQVGGGPQAVALDPTTNTIYTANFSDNTVSVVNGSRCSAEDTAECRARLPLVRVGSQPDGLAIDTATHSLYVANVGSDTVSVVDTTHCSASRTTGCGHLKATIKVGSGPTGVVIDPATHTVYVTDNGGGTVSVIDEATCNAEDQSGCRTTPGTVAVGSGPFGIALDQVTDTIYVTDLGTDDKGDTVSVIDGASCNAVVRSGCGQTPPEVNVGSGPFGIAVNPTTDTIYVANTGQLFTTANGDTVSVIDGATCNAARSSGCAQVPATVTVGRAPFGIAVDQGTNTIFVVNNQGGETDATLSTIIGNHCDAADTSSCYAPPPTLLGSGRAPNGIALDPRTHTLYTADFLSATVSAINLSGSTAERLAPRFAVGGAPEDVVFDPANRTVYVSSSLDGSVSVLPGTGLSQG